MTYDWTKVYYDPEKGEIVHETIPSSQVYVVVCIGFDPGSNDYAAETIAERLSDGTFLVTVTNEWRHQIDLTANRDGR